MYANLFRESYLGPGYTFSVMEDGHSENHTLNRVGNLCSDSRRRYVLTHLIEHEHGTIDEFSRQIAAEEAGTTCECVSEAKQQHVAISLVHNHLPRLAEHDIIEYDQRNGDIVLVATTEKLASLSEQPRQSEIAEESWRPAY